MNEAAIDAGPQFVAHYEPERGGVDFLGLRQVNLNMMAGVLPGINNVTWQIRPFSVVSWIYWKAYELSAASKKDLTKEQLRLWKEKVEVLFTWSHKLNGYEGLPGISSEPPHGGAVPLTFKDWGRNAAHTSLMAAVQYGPSAKTIDGLGFFEPEFAGAFRVCGEGRELAIALDACLMKCDRFKLLSSLTPGRVTAEQAKAYFHGWSVSSPTNKERDAFRRAFFREDAISEDSRLGARSRTIRLILDILARTNTACGVDDIRAGLFHGRLNVRGKRPWRSRLEFAWLRWQILQMRQLQRLAMEALLSWLEVRISRSEGSTTTIVANDAMELLKASSSLVPTGSAVGEIARRFEKSCSELDSFLYLSECDERWSPFSLMERLLECVSDENDDKVVAYAFRALFVCSAVVKSIAEVVGTQEVLKHGGPERISLAYLKDVLDSRSSQPMAEFIRYFFDNLILSQHFSVAGRRFDGGTQRLRISIEEEGLTLIANKRFVPAITADRLRTALSLMADCGLVLSHGEERYSVR